MRSLAAVLLAFALTTPPAAAQVGDLLVMAGPSSAIKRFDGSTGAYVEDFVAAGSGGLNVTIHFRYGPFGDLFVSNNVSPGVYSLLRYKGQTGAFKSTFVPANPPTRFWALAPRNGNLLAADFDSVREYHGASGAFLGTVAAANQGGFFTAMCIGPGGHIYLTDGGLAYIARIDGTSGALSVLVPSFTSGLFAPYDITIGPSGNLFVADPFSSVLEFDITSGALVGTFVPSGSGGMLGARGIAFGPDGNLYATNGTDSVWRYDGTTGAFIDVFATSPSDSLLYLSFIPTPPPNLPPVASAGPDQGLSENALATLDGSGSFDPEGDPLSYAWTQTAGTAVVLDESDPVHPTFTAPPVTQAGETLSFELIVDDGEDPSAPDTVEVAVANVNNPPVAKAGIDQDVLSGNMVTLDASKSSDDDGELLTFFWTQVAGPLVSLSSPTSAATTFVAPAVAIGTDTLGFEVSVSDGIDTSVDQTDAEVYPTTTWVGTQSSKLIASDAAANGRFGIAVATDADTLIVGARGPVDEGAAYVFERDQGQPGSWIEIQKLTASDGFSQNYFGYAVAIDGDTLVVGDLGAEAAYVFARDPGGSGLWNEVAKIVSSNGTGSADHFGISVAISGNTIAVGADGHDHSGVNSPGSVYVFERDAGGPENWGETKWLTGPSPEESVDFGQAVALDGDTLLVGDHYKDGPTTINQGAGYMFERDSGGANAWGLSKVLNPPGNEDGQFGWSVSIDQDTAVIGAYRQNFQGIAQAGMAFVYERDAGGLGGWGEVAQLFASDAGSSDRFGNAVSIVGNRAVVGASLDDYLGLSTPGSAYVFERDHGGPDSWGEVSKLIPNDPADGDFFGHSVAVSLSGVVLVGSRGDDHQAGTDAGSAYLFDVSQATVGVSYSTAGTSASGCQVLLSTAGLASATASSGFDLLASNAEGQKDGVYFFGTNGRQANPWGNGTSYQSVAPPVSRAPLMSGTGTIGACDGAFALDMNALWCPTCPGSNKNPGPGAYVQAQLWYRDPQNTSNQTTSLSQPLEFWVVP